MINISQKQYLISSVKREILDMREIHLSCEAYLYVGNGLLVRCLNDFKGRSYWILGNVFCVDILGTSVENCIASFDGHDLNELVENWTGRWLLISENEIQTDATGLMSVFFTIGKDWCISSSLALMSVVTGEKPLYKVENQGLTWQLLPETLIDGVKCLLCTQKIKISEGLISVIFNPWIRDCRNLSTYEKVYELASILKVAIANIEKFSERDIWIALTAGKDSRLVLAAALAANVKFTTYTANHDNISSADRTYPVKIAKELGFSHKFIKADRIFQTKIEEYEIFTAGNSRGVDKLFYARGQFNKIPSNAVVIRGGLFEAGQLYARKIAGSELDSFCDGIEYYYQSALVNKKQSKAFTEWLTYVNANPIPFLDIRDRMYIGYSPHCTRLGERR